MTVGDVIAAIERLAPKPLAYEWDRPGLAIGSPDAKVSGVLTALGVNPAAVKVAKRAKSNLIVSHHPVIWSPLKALQTDDPHTAMCLDLAQTGIACYSAHTNLDVVPGGVNAVLAKTLGFEETAPLFPVEQAAQCKLVTFVPPDYLVKVRDAMCEAGAGIIGDYTYCSFSSEGTGTFLPGDRSNPFAGRVGELAEENERKLEVIVLEARIPPVVRALYESHPYEEPAYDLLALKNRDEAITLGLRGELSRPVQLDTFASQVRNRLDVSHVRVIGDGKRSVKRVAMLGGSGGSYIAQLPADVDVFVTGDVKYHEAELAALRGVTVIDAGHAGTEKCIAPALADYLKLQCKGLTVKAYIEPDYFRALTR